MAYFGESAGHFTGHGRLDNMSTPCEICGTAGQLYLCSYCIDNVQEMLDQIPEIVEELETRAQAPVQNRYKLRLSNSGGGKDSAMPGDLEMLRAIRRLRGMTTRAETLASSSEAREDTVSCLSDISHAQALLQDSPEVRVWGICTTPDCNQEIKAPMDHRRTRCPTCGWPKELADMINHRLDLMDSVPTPPRQTREALQSMTGIRVTKKTFENWVYHRKLRYVLDTVSTGGKERRLYFVRDVLLVHQQLNVLP